MQQHTNQLYYGDNLDVLRNKIKDESVDLCYIDPPFNSKRNYFQIYNNQGTEDPAQAQAFIDTWEWGDEADAALEWLTDIKQLQNGKLTEQTVELIKGLEKVLKHGSLLAYVVSITLRVVEIHRVLKPTGSFYLHCDPTASHYLKLILDAIFCGQGGDFRNEIIWSYESGGRSKQDFGRKHDVIFRYTKSKMFLFDGMAVSLPRSEARHNHMKKQTDETGRVFSSIKSNGKIYKYYDDEGVIPTDVWPISHLQQKDPERLGYPTQKPEALLERIIKASSHEGDVVLDAYCGCGTTVAVAQRLNRQWIGIDITYQSISLILKRLADTYPEQWAEIEAHIKLDGVPRDMESAQALANRKDDKTRKEFEKWAVLSYSMNQARINEKKGGDGGIDGIAYFLVDKGKNGKAIFSVKSDKSVAPAYVDQLAGTMAREGAEFGFLLCLNAPSAGVYKRAQSNGKYRHQLLNRDYDRVQIITVQDIMNGLRLDLPMARPDAVKSAVNSGDADRQEVLL
jgi:DNA modification methylase